MAGIVTQVVKLTNVIGDGRLPTTDLVGVSTTRYVTGAATAALNWRRHSLQYGSGSSTDRALPLGTVRERRQHSPGVATRYGTGAVATALTRGGRQVRTQNARSLECGRYRCRAEWRRPVSAEPNVVQTTQ